MKRTRTCPYRGGELKRDTPTSYVCKLCGLRYPSRLVRGRDWFSFRAHAQDAVNDLVAQGMNIEDVRPSLGVLFTAIVKEYT